MFGLAGLEGRPEQARDRQTNHAQYGRQASSIKASQHEGYLC